jgi:fatty-acyl-CoA synthase
LNDLRRVSKPPESRTSVAKDWLRALEMTAPITANPQRTLPRIIEELAEKGPDVPALLSARESMNYGRLVERANRYARWALESGLEKNEIVALMMPNRPEYLAIWVGLTSVGIVVALLNTQLRGHSLAHCVDLVAPRHIIVADEHIEQLLSAVDRLQSRPKICSHGGGEFAAIDQLLQQFSGEPLTSTERPQVTIADRALLIYTSGTTGLPKAAKVSHQRLLEWSFWFAGLMDTGPNDRMYDCLPMYHSVGGIVATGAVLVRGGSVVIRDKFSVQQFWNDVVKWDCTLVQYIGELCRYLVNAPGDAREQAHRVRICCGNGLAADVWEKFQHRFAIPRILEFYASTEGNVSLYNVEGKIGAIGRVPSFLAHRFPLALVQFDSAACEPIRDDQGFCVRCARNEVGEAIGRIRSGSSYLGGRFEGYTSDTESERKILHDVFERGDAWYRTGDLMRMDESGYFYFVDRIGDTFRWKGENVASSEVAAAITAFPGIVEASVYGVHVPDSEGAAGMATIVANEALDLVRLRDHLARRLPDYARPVFLRVTDKIEPTPTFKHTKVDLRREGYNPDSSIDPIYFDHPGEQAFIRLGQALYDQITAGKIRL